MVSREVFQFRQFSIANHSSVMPVSTDSVLLGSWANVNSARNILDVGCGSGLLSLMAAQRNSKAQITGIDINQDAIQLARQNAKVTPWALRMSFYQQDFTQLKQTQGPSFDFILSNPPYFQSGTSSINESRDGYRHTHSEFFGAFFRNAHALSADECRLSLIIPSAQRNDMCIKALRYGWYLSREIHVYHTSTASSSLCLLEWSKNYDIISDAPDKLQLFDSAQNKTPAFEKLTQAFYL